MATLIPVSRGKKGYAIVNDDIAEQVLRHPWRIVGKCRYPVTTLWEEEKPNGKVVTMHRFIYKLLYGFYPGKGEEIDHIDRNRLNNLDNNMRRVTKSFQQANIGAKKGKNKSGFKSVYRQTFKKKNHLWKAHTYWMAELIKDGEKVFRALFPNTEAGWRAAAKAINDQYAVLFPGVAPPNPDWFTRPYPYRG